MRPPRTSRGPVAAQMRLPEPARAGVAARLRPGMAARMRHDRESLTESTPPPPAPPPVTVRAGSAPSPEAPVVSGVAVAKTRDALVVDCEIEEWDRFVQLVRDRRQTVGGRLGCWTGAHLLAALHLAIRNRGWPPAQAARALLAVASDPETRSPARLAEAGPWWDDPSAPAGATSTAAAAAELAGMEADLASAGGLRVRLQAEARDTLALEGVPLTRTTVVQHAHRLWLEHRGRCLDETAVGVSVR